MRRLTEEKTKTNISLKYNVPKYKKIFKRGDVVFTDFGITKGSVMGGKRIAVVVSNDSANERGNTVLLVPLTKVENKLKKEGFVRLRRGQSVLRMKNYNFLTHDSIVQTIDVRPFSKKEIFRKVGRINEDDMKNINEALRHTLHL